MPTEVTFHGAEWGWVQKFAPLRQPLLFSLVGIVNTGIDFTVFLLLVHTGLQPLVANTVSFSLGAVNSYILNGRVTFAVAGRRTRSGRMILRFAVVTLCGLALSHAVVWSALSLTLPAASAKALSVLATFAFGFVMSKLLVFTTTDTTAEVPK